MLAWAILIAADLCAAVPDEAQHEAQARFEAAEAPLLDARWQDAEGPLREALDLDPSHALAHYGLGQALFGLGRFREAAETFARSREAFRCVLGADLERRAALGRDRDRQIQQLREALRTTERDQMKAQLIPWQQMNSRESRPSLSSRLGVVRELEERLAELERVRKGGDPAPLGVTLALGTALIQAGALAEAEVELRGLLEADPRSGDAHNNLAVVLLATGRLDEAEREARLAQKQGVPVNPRLFEEIRKRREAARR